MAEFDAELYLRLAGERPLLDPPGDDGPAESSPLEAAGHALVAVGAITAGAAQAIVDDYRLALSYRRGEHPHRRHVLARRSALSSSSPGQSLSALRAVACGRLIERSGAGRSVPPGPAGVLAGAPRAGRHRARHRHRRSTQ